MRHGMAKLAVVPALSALRDIQAGALRCLVADSACRKPCAALRFATHGILLAMATVVALAILKPI